MEPQGRSVSPLRTRKRSWTLGPSKTTLGSRSGRSSGWAECREKNVGIGPTGRFFLLTFPLIGQCYRLARKLLISKPLVILARDNATPYSLRGKTQPNVGVQHRIPPAFKP